MAMRRWIRGLAFIACFVLLEQLVCFFVYPPSYYYSYETRADRRANRGTVDLAFVGNSRVHRGFDPSAFDGLLGCNSFNLGTEAQSLGDSYYALMDLFETDPVEVVLLALAPASLMDSAQTQNITRSIIVHEQMLTSAAQTAQVRDCFSLDDLPRLVFRSMNCRKYFHPRKIVDTVRTKLSASYRAGGYRSPAYRLKGFIAKDVTPEAGGFGSGRVQDWTGQADGQALADLERIVELCREREAQLILCVAPFTDCYLLKMADYDGFHRYAAGLAQQHGVPFWDFNYAQDLAAALDDSHFGDIGHLSEQGARLFSEYCAQTLADYRAGEALTGRFLPSFEALAAQMDAVSGVSLEAEAGVIRARAIAAPQLSAEYRFLGRARGEQAFREIRPYAPSGEIALDAGMARVRVECRSVGSTRAYEAFAEIKLN